MPQEVKNITAVENRDLLIGQYNLCVCLRPRLYMGPYKRSEENRQKMFEAYNSITTLTARRLMEAAPADRFKILSEDCDYFINNASMFNEEEVERANFYAMVAIKAVEISTEPATSTT